MITEPHLSSFYNLLSIFFAFTDSIFILSVILSNFFMSQIKNKVIKIKAITNEAELNSFNIYSTNGKFISIKFLIGVYSVSSKFTVLSIISKV